MKHNASQQAVEKVRIGCTASCISNQRPLQGWIQFARLGGMGEEEDKLQGWQVWEEARKSGRAKGGVATSNESGGRSDVFKEGAQERLREHLP